MFADRYRTTFASLGQALKPEHGISSQTLQQIVPEGIHLPDALRDYYLVAGNEQHFNQSFNRLIAPAKLELEAGRIVFMEENQDVVYWGVPNQSTDADPIVEQGVNVENEPLEWHSEHARCADFLEVMVYWQASFGGGLKYCVGAPTTLETQARLERDFRLVGVVGELHAYARQDCALSFLKWQEDGHEWRMFAGFNTRKLQTAVGRELGLRWEEY